MTAKKKSATTKKKSDLKIAELPTGNHFKLLMSQEHSSRLKALVEEINQRSLTIKQDNSDALASTTNDQEDIAS